MSRNKILIMRCSKYLFCFVFFLFVWEYHNAGNFFCKMLILLFFSILQTFAKVSKGFRSVVEQNTLVIFLVILLVFAKIRVFLLYLIPKNHEILSWNHARKIIHNTIQMYLKSRLYFKLNYLLCVCFVIVFR